MKADQKAQVAEVFDNVEDQLTNIEAIKGAKYAKLTALVVSNYSAAYCILKVIANQEANEKEIELTLDACGTILTTSGTHVIQAYARSLGITDAEYVEAVADGKRIVNNNNTHMERISHD